MGTRCCTRVESPVGELLLLSDGEALTGLYMDAQKYRPALPDDVRIADAPFACVREQLSAYFGGELRTFDVPLAPAGTQFQKSVWKALLDIPFGATESYSALAARIGRANASRAVGLANGRNPIGIIVPCHRVIGADGSLTGYGGGIERKRWLLEHERRLAASAHASGALHALALGDR